MSNRQRRLWLSLLVLVLAALPGLHGQARAAQYAVVANSGNGTVSVVENSGSGWQAVADSAVSVGGTPWGVATSGQYAFVANTDGYLNIMQASLSVGGEVSLSLQQSVEVGPRVQWVAASSYDKVYVSALGSESELGGSLYQLTKSGDAWSSSKLSLGNYYFPQGLALIPANGDAGEKLAVAKNPLVGSGNEDSVQIFQDDLPFRSQNFTDGMPMHVAPWIEGARQFAIVTRRTATQPGGILTAFDVVTGAYYEEILQYSPYAVAVVDSYAYVTDYNSQDIYKYSLGLLEGSSTPTMIFDSKFALGSIGGVRQLIDSGDNHLLVTTNAGNTVHSIDLSNFGSSGAVSVGTFSGAVGIGLIDPLATDPDPVPEPSALATLATGLLAAAGGALRRKGRGKEG